MKRNNTTKCTCKFNTKWTLLRIHKNLFEIIFLLLMFKNFICRKRILSFEYTCQSKWVVLVSWMCDIRIDYSYYEFQTSKLPENHLYMWQFFTRNSKNANYDRSLSESLSFVSHFFSTRVALTIKNSLHFKYLKLIYFELFRKILMVQIFPGSNGMVSDLYDFNEFLKNPFEHIVSPFIL